MSGLQRNRDDVHLSRSSATLSQRPSVSHAQLLSGTACVPRDTVGNLYDGEVRCMMGERAPRDGIQCNCS